MNFYSVVIKSALISDTFENWRKKTKYGSKCLKLPKSSRNAKKIVALSKVSLIRALLNVLLLTTL